MKQQQQQKDEETYVKASLNECSVWNCIKERSSIWKSNIWIFFFSWGAKRRENVV